MTKEEQINIIKEVKERLRLKTESQFLCLLFERVLSSRHHRFNINSEWEEEIKKHIPLFDRKIAAKFGATQNTSYSCWWKSYNIEARIKYLDWMIKKLSKITFKELICKLLKKFKFLKK